MAPVTQKNRSAVAPSVAAHERNGKAILKRLASGLRQRGVPNSSYIIVNTANGEFVTGKTKDEARQRFALMHSGVEGWMQQLGDVIEDPDDLPTIARTPTASSSSRSLVAKARVDHQGRNRPFARREHDQFQTRAR